MTATVIQLRAAANAIAPQVDADPTKIMERARLLRQLADMWGVDLRLAAAIEPQGTAPN